MLLVLMKDQSNFYKGDSNSIAQYSICFQDIDYFRQYIPQVTRALSKYSLNPAKKIGLFKYFMKMIKKMVFAFLFQEQTFEIDFLTSPLANQVG